MQLITRHTVRFFTSPYINSFSSTSFHTFPLIEVNPFIKTSLVWQIHYYTWITVHQLIGVHYNIGDIHMWRTPKQRESKYCPRLSKIWNKQTRPFTLNIRVILINFFFTSPILSSWLSHPLSKFIWSNYITSVFSICITRNWRQMSPQATRPKINRKTTKDLKKGSTRGCWYARGQMVSAQGHLLPQAANHYADWCLSRGNFSNTIFFDKF